MKQEEKPITAEILRGHNNHKSRLAILERHLKDNFYKTGELHIAISEAMEEACRLSKIEALEEAIEELGERFNTGTKTINSRYFDGLRYSIELLTKQIDNLKGNNNGE